MLLPMSHMVCKLTCCNLPTLFTRPTLTASHTCCFMKKHSLLGSDVSGRAASCWEFPISHSLFGQSPEGKGDTDKTYSGWSKSAITEVVKLQAEQQQQRSFSCWEVLICHIAIDQEVRHQDIIELLGRGAERSNSADLHGGNHFLPGFAGLGFRGKNYQIMHGVYTFLMPHLWIVQKLLAIH